MLKQNGVLFITFHAGEKKLPVENFFESEKSLVFYYFDEDKIIGYLHETGFEMKEALVRLPCKEEYPSRRAYILAEKK